MSMLPSSGAGKPVAALVVAVHGQVAKEVVPLAQTKLTGEQAALSAGVNHVASRATRPRRWLGRGGFQIRPYAWIPGNGPATAVPLIVERDAGGLATLSHIHAGAAGVVEQDGVELGSPHLECGGVAGVGLAEMPAPRFPVGAPDHGRAALDGESGPFYLVQHAQILQDGDAGRQQRFAHVSTREAFAFQQYDRESLAGKEGAGAGPGGSAADDDDRWFGHGRLATTQAAAGGRRD